MADEATALRIALVFFERYWGEAATAAGRPYKAFRDGDDWVIISDELPPGTFGGGHPELVMAARDGRVSRMALSK